MFVEIIYRLFTPEIGYMAFCLQVAFLTFVDMRNALKSCAETESEIRGKPTSRYDRWSMYAYVAAIAIFTGIAWPVFLATHVYRDYLTKFPGEKK